MTPAHAAGSRSFRNALKWSYAMDIGRQGTTLVVSFILAGVLGPGAYGVVALATVYISFLQLLLAQGMVPAVIQRRDLRAEHKDAAFWMVMASSTLLTVATVPLSRLWANLNDTPQLGPVVLVLSIMLPIEGLRVVHEGLMRRDLNMRPLAIRTNIAVISGGVVGIVAAFVLRNVWALVAQQLTTAVVDVVVLWAYSAWRPRFRFAGWAARDLLSFSIGSSFASLGSFVNGRADVMATGAFFGPVAVGLYRFASRLVDTAISVTVSSLQGASLPELARHQHDPDRFAERMAAVLRASALLSLPLLGILAGVANPLMDAVGPEWQRAAAPLQILCIMGGGRALTMLVGPMLQALGRTRLLASLAWVNAGLSAGAFVLAGLALEGASVGDQVVAMSWSRAALYAFVFLAVNMAVMGTVTRVSVGTVFKTNAPSLLAGLAGAAVGAAVSTALAPVTHGLVLLAATGAASAAAVGVMLYAAEPTIRQAVGRQLARRGWGGFTTAAHASAGSRGLFESILG